MLSRLAESSFWMGRYLERAEGISRLLIEFHQLLIKDERSHIVRGCALLTHGLGIDSRADSARELVKVVYGGHENPSTILGALDGARSNARSIRDILPSDFYEAINRLSAATLEFNLDTPGDSLKIILDRLAVANGIYEWLAPHDEPSAFFELGRSLERLDLVSRLLSLRLENEWREEGSTTTLRSIGALSTFLKSRQPISASTVRPFLVGDSNFPRSLFSSALSAELSLVKIGKMTKTSTHDVLRPIAILGNQILHLEGDVIEQENLILHTPQKVNETTENIKLVFFRPIGSIVWNN